MVEDREQEEAHIPSKWLTCNGRQLRKLAQAGLAWLEENYQQVNALNVFPVPDGDTGTNMLLTLRAACKRIEGSQEEHVGKMAHELAQGALMGARGNSGVILSQILRGLAGSLAGKATFNTKDLAKALVETTETAYGGVIRPVEGTILTVVREASEEARDAAQKSTDLRFVLERILERAQQALERTPEQLPILKRAGVVDAGGQGLVYIFEGMLRYVHGDIEVMASPTSQTAPMPAQALAVPEGGLLENPYDVQFILLGQKLDVDAVRRRIDAMGDSTVVVGDETTIKVHVHVKDPGQPISYGIGLGTITDVVVENMQMQMESIVGQAGRDEATGNDVSAEGEDSSPVIAPLQPDRIGVVAVASGDGLAEIFRSLGAVCVVNGGQTNNPSIEEILKAIEGAPTEKVIVLPNNKNVVPAAEAAREITHKQVAVVPTRSVPQGISAMLGLNPGGEVGETAAAMAVAAGEVATGEITTATRSVDLGDVMVKEGELIGLVDGRICVSGGSVEAVMTHLLAALGADDRELISLYYGDDVDRDEAEAMAGHISALYPDLDMEVLPGGQAHYFYILGAE